MEVLYKKLYAFRYNILEYWAIYFISVVMNYLGEHDLLKGELTFWEKMTNMGNSPVFVLVILTAVLVA